MLPLTCSPGQPKPGLFLCPPPRAPGAPSRTSLGAGAAEGHDGCQKDKEGHASSDGHPDDDGHRYSLCGREGGRLTGEPGQSALPRGLHPAPRAQPLPSSGRGRAWERPRGPGQALAEATGVSSGGDRGHVEGAGGLRKMGSSDEGETRQADMEGRGAWR